KLRLNGSEDPEIHTNFVARRHWDRRDAGTGRHDLTSEQTGTEQAQLVGDPRHSHPRIAENIGSAAAGNEAAVTVSVNVMLSEIEFAPIPVCRCAQNKPAGTRVIGNQLRGAHGGVVFIT